MKPLLLILGVLMLLALAPFVLLMLPLVIVMPWLAAVLKEAAGKGY